MYGTRYSKRARGVSAVGLEEDTEDDGDMECEVTRLPEPRMIYSDSDTSDKDEKLSWNEDSESGMGTEDGELEVHDSGPGSQTWVTRTSDPSSSDSSPAHSDLSSHQHSDVRCDFSPSTGSVDRTFDPTGSSWSCGVSFQPQRPAENWEAL